jgi:hypothetical protein
MLDNLPPDWREEQDHDPRCRVRCEWISAAFVEDDACIAHDDHYCTCDELFEAWQENNVDALLDMREGRR